MLLKSVIVCLCSFHLLLLKRLCPTSATLTLPRRMDHCSAIFFVYKCHCSLARINASLHEQPCMLTIDTCKHHQRHAYRNAGYQSRAHVQMDTCSSDGKSSASSSSASSITSRPSHKLSLRQSGITFSCCIYVLRVCIYKFGCICICLYIYIYTYTNSNTRTITHTRTHIHTHTRVHTHA